MDDKNRLKIPVPYLGNEVVIARNAGGNLVNCGQAMVEICQGFMYSL